MPVDEWPELDRAAWLKAVQPFDPFDPSVGLADRWRPVSQNMIAASYGRWLGWLALTGALDADSAPGHRATRATVAAYRDGLREGGLADYSVAGRISDLGEALAVIDPTGDWSWIGLAGSRLHAKAVPTRDIVGIMQPPQALLQLGDDLMDAAETQRFRTPCGRATLFRDGLLLSFLTLRPFRMANLASLMLGDNLVECDGWKIRISAGATKGNAAIECAWPKRLSAGLNRYLELHREVLLEGALDGSNTRALWVSKRGTQMGSHALSFQIKGRTEEEFGRAINPHTFRHIAATTIATWDPSEAYAIALLLGHKSMRASEKFYNRAEMLGAGESLQANVAALRKRSLNRRSSAPNRP